jgi:hypothetical protein
MNAPKGQRIIDCVVAEKRALVCDLFIRLLGEKRNLNANL